VPVAAPDDRYAWTEPGVERVAPGVHRVPLPLPNDALRAVNVYVLETADGLVLIDAGWAIDGARRCLEAGLAEIGGELADIARFLVTHVHRDHYSQATAIRAEFGTRVELGIGERPTIEVLGSPGARPLRSQVALLPELGAADLATRIAAAVADHDVDPHQWLPPDAWIEPGAIALPGGRTLEAVETPGHTAGHLVFHDVAGQLLFAGDHVLPTITPSIGFEPVPTAAPLADFLHSLAVVRSRPDAVLLPAHGPVTDSAHRRCDELVRHHEDRLAEMLAICGSSASPTVFEVAAAVPWTKRRRALADLDTFNQMLAVFETAAHLDLLVSRAALTVATSDGVRRFSLAPRARL
jgi:glyoxylase-like metal-dependent hydrolase (beta-lactamase superfamily II)